MASDVYDRPGHDRVAVDVDDPAELEYWVTELGVGEREIRAAVEAVGPQAVAVREYLASHLTATPDDAPEAPRQPGAPGAAEPDRMPAGARR
ncbi:MAG TPA: DUF3606 domain-containing protein [Burkholderiaceae bacterium]|nr:DUF3606 domain-containing protein [Burkholderiaceae bacterium]